VLGIIALSFTLISVFTLSGPGPFSLLRRRESVVLKASLPDAPLTWFIRPTTRHLHTTILTWRFKFCGQQTAFLPLW
jgi:hypothetical protein